MNVEKIREDFPLVKKCVYFDNAATTLTPKPVLEAVDGYYLEYRANIHRGAHFLTKRASEEYELVYEKLAKFFNAKSGEFSSAKNATEAINLVALGVKWRKNASVVATNIEHHSNLLPWVRLEKLGVIKLKIVEADKRGEFNLSDFEE
ncbi:aminotransferase class V-fold PLP-dependent enzyme, partial [Candidatus Micrarchaeota archaeon]|nr:aminotransferase class V-fold PLP-dependent enzyme [Candidatus Micrarchaeota archaeon]